jgi:hypothetical protein
LDVVGRAGGIGWIAHLEVDAHDHQDVARGIVLLLVRHTAHNHPHRDRQVEGVERRLVLDDQRPPRQREVGQAEVHAQRVEQLAALGLEGRLEHEVEQLHIVGLVAKVALDDLRAKGKAERARRQESAQLSR